MIVIFKTLTFKSFNIEINNDDTILLLKEKIQNITGIHPLEQNLYFKLTKLFEDTYTLNDYNITDNSIVFFSPHFRK